MLPGREVVFKVSTKGLYFQDTVDRAIVLLNTETENCEGFTHREYKGSDAASCALKLVGYLPERKISIMVSSNMKTNSTVTSHKIQNSNKIFGPDIPSMKGKSFRRRPKSAVRDYVEILEEILRMKTDLEVLVDVIFVNKLPFLVSTSKILKFTTT